MEESSFKIYNASAGSGKTYTLAKSYLRILLSTNDSQRFKHILAVTFTNKAVGEMKERIINMLQLFAQYIERKSQAHPMLDEISVEIGQTKSTIAKRAIVVLETILHNYGAFDVSTIDGFTHRVIRTFAPDLKLPVNFEVELDQEQILNEAVNALIDKAGNDEALTEILIDFALEKTDEDKSWDIGYDLNKIAQLLLNENDRVHIENLKDKPLHDFKKLKNYLSLKIKKCNASITQIAKETLDLIEQAGLEFEDFNRKSLPNHFLKLYEGQLNLSFESAWQNQLIEGGTLYPKRVEQHLASVIEDIQPQLSDAYQTTKKLVYEIRFLKSAYNHITPLSVLSAIQKEVELIKTEQNKILISEFNTIISKEIKDQPTPFIYERLGEKFQHYFIDEFQDTSRMQWENLVPLIDNVLSSGGSAMLVGDAKQAIYRWRGGDPEQFIALYNQKGNPFQVKAQIENLGKNYRSSKTIVEFNNSFFKFLGETYFSNQEHGDIYKDSGQIVSSEKTGYVSLSFLEADKTELQQDYCNEVLKKITLCIEHGFSLSDICIITRKRKEGVEIAEFLIQNDIKITSSETLLLKNSKEVKFLNAFLRLLLEPNNDNLKLEILSFLVEKEKVFDKHSFYQSHLKPNLDEFLQQLKSLGYKLNKKKLNLMPLVDMVEYLIYVFKFSNEASAFLIFYVDLVFEYSKKHGSDLRGFINYFELNQDKISITLPENMDAVRIMTIHKSKGLEFPVVIFSFAHLDIYRELQPKTWFPVNPDDYLGFGNLLINYNRDLKHYSNIGKELFLQHQSQLELDNINLLYVVLTRAVDQLYIISKKDMIKDQPNPKTFAGMFINYLQNSQLWADDKTEYSFGKLKQQPQRNNNCSEHLQFTTTPKDLKGIKTVSKSGVLWDTPQALALEKGNLIHVAMAHIKTTEDVDYAMQQVKASEELNEIELNSLKETVLFIVKHKKLKSYFSQDYTIYNETDILTTDGKYLRPDRIVVKHKNATVIDYKTGLSQQNHKEQITEYADAVDAMGFSIDKKLLVYINDRIEILEV